LIKESTDFAAITNLAVQFSDGIIQGSPGINEEVVDFVKSTTKPFLPYQNDETYIDAYNDFYDVILKTKK
jgi:starch synthase